MLIHVPLQETSVYMAFMSNLIHILFSLDLEQRRRQQLANGNYLLLIYIADYSKHKLNLFACMIFYCD